VLRVPEAASQQEPAEVEDAAVPEPATREPEPVAAKPEPEAAAPEATLPDGWYMKTEEGEDYGPVPKAELDQWVEEGRITSDCQILQDGAEQWQWASDVYPELDDAEPETGAEAPPPSVAPPVKPPASSGGGATETSAFAFAAADASPTARVRGGAKKVVRRKRRRGPSGEKSAAVTIVAIVNFVFAGLQLLCGMLVTLAGGLFAGAVGTLAARAEKVDPEAATAAGLVSALIIGYGVTVLLVGALMIVCGVGIIKRASWARVLTLILGGIAGVLAVFSLVSLCRGNVPSIVPVLLDSGYCALVFIVLLNRRYAEEFGYGPMHLSQPSTICCGLIISRYGDGPI